MVTDRELRFSGFGFGYINKKKKAVPATRVDSTYTPLSCYYYIISEHARQATKELRENVNSEDSQRFKMLNFVGATFSGTFSYRKAESLLKHSGLMVIDIDGISSYKKLMDIKETLIADPKFTTILLFVSPSGNGLKWIIYVGNMGGMQHSDCFTVVRRYLKDNYDIEADRSGSDVCRLCYLPYDPHCYINPALLAEHITNINKY